MTIADEIQARLDFVKFDPNWVPHTPKPGTKEECVNYRRMTSNERQIATGPWSSLARTMSDRAIGWFVCFCYEHYDEGPTHINDYRPKNKLIEVLEAAVKAAKEAGI